MALRRVALTLTLALTSTGGGAALMGCGGGGNTLDSGAVEAGGGDGGDADGGGGGDDAGGGREVTFTPRAAGRTVEPGVRREVFTVAAPAAQANPVTTARAPRMLDAVRVVRYRADGERVAPVRAVVIAMPGFLGGAGSFEGLARAIVRRGAAEGAGGVEVWAIDRRSNLLEDLRGMDAADALGDAEIARGYYLDRDVALNGERFRGFLDARDGSIAYLSEWGLATTVNDLRAVVALVPDSRAHVVLLGHSLGASIVEAYAAWDFDGVAGSRGVAGLVYVDGVAPGSAISEAQYFEGGTTGAGGLPFAGLRALRASGPYFFALPLLGVRALAVAEVIARRALAAPDAVVADRHRDGLLRTLLGVSSVPRMTNAAAMGFGFDDGSCPLEFVRMTLGRPTGGPTARTQNPFGAGQIEVPAGQGGETYAWTDARAVAPAEFTPVALAAAGFAASPTNFAEWYFPSRLSLDVSALGDLRLADGTWQAREGLRARHGGAVDAPLLAVAAAFTIRAGTYDAARARLSAAVGDGRPAAGVPRTDPRAFRVLAAPGLTHVDPVTAADVAGNPVPEAVAAFALANTTGSVSVPVRE